MHGVEIAAATQDAPLAEEQRAGHRRWIRVCHWSVAASIFILAFSGLVILMAHPRLYWGRVGNDLTPALVQLPISRNYKHNQLVQRTPFFQGSESPVDAIRTNDIWTKNNWARSLHFLGAWVLVIFSGIYLGAGVASGHFRRHWIPRRRELTAKLLWLDVVNHLRLIIEPAGGGPPYGLLQKLSYSALFFVVLPLIIWTGLAMSPALNLGYPFLADALGGSQSARTVHFVCFCLFGLFIAVHVIMVMLSGFQRQMRAMTIGE